VLTRSTPFAKHRIERIGYLQMDFLKLVMGSTEIEAAPPLSSGASLLIRTVVVDSAGAACALFWLAVLDQRNADDAP
jgi:hypothetical protein